VTLAGIVARGLVGAPVLARRLVGRGGRIIGTAGRGGLVCGRRRGLIANLFLGAIAVAAGGSRIAVDQRGKAVIVIRRVGAARPLRGSLERCGCCDFWGNADHGRLSQWNWQSL